MKSHVPQDPQAERGEARFFVWLRRVLHRRDTREVVDAPHFELNASDDSTASATGAAMAHVLARPDSIRQRALNAATISSAVIAALAVALLTEVAGSETESWRLGTKLALIAAPILWIVTIALYVTVVTLGPPRNVQGFGYQAVVAAYEAYSDSLRTRLRVAARCSVGALAVTALAVGFVVAEVSYVRERDRQLVLTQTGMSAVAALCRWHEETAKADARINVTVSSDELSNEVVEMDVLSRPTGAPTRCHAATQEMRIPRSSILAAGDLDP